MKIVALIALQFCYFVGINIVHQTNGALLHISISNYNVFVFLSGKTLYSCKIGDAINHLISGLAVTPYLSSNTEEAGSTATDKEVHQED